METTVFYSQFVKLKFGDKSTQSDKAVLWFMDFIGINSYFLQSLHF